MSSTDSAPRRFRAFRWIGRILVRLVGAVAITIATLLLLEAFRDRGYPPLQRWHTVVPADEFTAEDAVAGYDFEDYLANERALFTELEAYMLPLGAPGAISPVIRFVRGGEGDPATFDPDWNRTVELQPQGERVGAALLLHGLSDSPYSMRTLATTLSEAGYHVVCLRLPGHGTVPAGLLHVTVDDWMEALAIAWRHVLGIAGPDGRLVLGGYSNGGALSVEFTLTLLESGARTPDRIFLFSPAIGITPFAVASNWHRLYSWMPYFEKSKWLSIEPEYDPFKYNSFAKNAGAQSWNLSRRIQARLARAAKGGEIDRLPPMTTFQSAVDSTVIASDVVTHLYARLPSNGSRLFLFDVNRNAFLEGFYAINRMPLDELAARTDLPYELTVVGNANLETREVVARTRPAASEALTETALGAEWPHQVYSLAHVSLPFPVDDVLYGSTPPKSGARRVHIGELSLRGEKNVLSIASADLMRLRYNPFHAWMIERIREDLARMAGPARPGAPAP